MSELKDFLENVRKHSSRIGEVAMRHVRKILAIRFRLRLQDSTCIFIT